MRASIRRLLGGDRSCPLSYRYGANALSKCKDLVYDGPLFVVGGLYGNLEAYAAVERRAAEETVRPLVCFNGDFNFFNITSLEFEQINCAIMQNPACVATAGNVEVETASSESDGSCGCAYPAYVSDTLVGRSNEIVRRLRQVASSNESILSWMRSLPKFRTVRLGRSRIGIIHGDPSSLAGWEFSSEALEPADHALRESLGCSRQFVALCI
jgi:hypothetical protein